MYKMCQWCVGDFVWALLMQSNAKPSFSTLICNVVFGKLSLAVWKWIISFGHHFVYHVIGTQSLLSYLSWLSIRWTFPLFFHKKTLIFQTDTCCRVFKFLTPKTLQFYYVGHWLFQTWWLLKEPFFWRRSPLLPQNGDDLEFLFLCGWSYYCFGSVLADALVNLTNP